MKMFKNKWFIFTFIIMIFFIGNFYFPFIIADILKVDLFNTKPKDYNLVMFINSIILVIIYILICRKDLVKDFKDFIKHFDKYFSIGFKYWLIGIAIMFFANNIIGNLIPSANANNEDIIQEFIKISPIISLIMTAITAPFIEEIAFRKSFKTIINNKTIYILFAGITFGAAHVVFTLTSAYDLFYIIPYAGLGIVLSLMYYETDNIFTSIFMHALHNGIFTILSIVLYLVGGK